MIIYNFSRVSQTIFSLTVMYYLAPLMQKNLTTGTLNLEHVNHPKRDCGEIEEVYHRIRTSSLRRYNSRYSQFSGLFHDQNDKPVAIRFFFFWNNVIAN